MKILLTIAVFPLLLTLVFFASRISVMAQAQQAPICVPAACNQPGQYEPDFDCVNKQLLDPRAKDRNSPQWCCENKCVGTTGTPRPEGLRPLFTFFGYSFAVTDGQQIPTLINLAFTTFLGFISVYAIVVGIYTAGVKRARTTNEEEIAQANKTLVTLIAGFVLAWSFIFIIQLVASLLGLGSLGNLQITGQGGGIDIIIR